MRLQNTIFFVLLILFQISSFAQIEYVKHVDQEKYYHLGEDGITIDQGKELQAKIYREIVANTVGKRLPPIKVQNSDGDSISLEDIIHDTTLLYFSGVHCGWGMEGLTVDLPNAIDSLKNDSVQLKVFCLLVRYERDLDNPQKLKRTFSDISAFHNQVFIIDEDLAESINMTANPSWILVDDNQNVFHMRYGFNPSNPLFDQLSEKLLLIRVQEPADK